MTAAAIALGSNLGNRLEHLRAGVAAIAALPDTRLLAVSGVDETAAVVPAGEAQGPDYLNAVVLVATELRPRELLAGLLEIERSRGRDRQSGRRWAARTLDLDLLFFGDLVLDDPGPPAVRLPHPEMARRAFVLGPLARVAPDWVHPRLGRTVREMLTDLEPAQA